MDHNSGVKRRETDSEKVEKLWLDRFWEIFSAQSERASDYQEKGPYLETLARFAIDADHPIDDVNDIDTFYELRSAHYEAVHGFKPRKALPNSTKGSLHRLLRYIDLKRELASPGMSLMPQVTQHQAPLRGGEVIEITLGFGIKRGSEHHRLFNIDSLPAPIKPWLERVVQALGDDEAASFSDTFSASMKRYDTEEDWKAEKVMGYQKVAHELLEGFPAAVELPGGLRGNTSLVVLEPQIRPRSLAAIWDSIYLENKVEQQSQALYLEAMQAAQNDFDALTIEDFFEYYWPRYLKQLKHDGKEFEYTEEAKQEQLKIYMPQLMAAWRSERLEAFRVERYAAIDFNAKEAEMRAKKKSAHRAKPIELQQEILGRVAYDVCLEGRWKGDRTFSRAVWEKYREQARAYGVDPDHYGKAGSAGIKSVNKNLDYIEHQITECMQQLSPFREDPFAFAEKQRRKGSKGKALRV